MPFIINYPDDGLTSGSVHVVEQFKLFLRQKKRERGPITMISLTDATDCLPLWSVCRQNHPRLQLLLYPMWLPSLSLSHWLKAIEKRGGRRGESFEGDFYHHPLSSIDTEVTVVGSRWFWKIGTVWTDALVGERESYSLIFCHRLNITFDRHYVL